MMISAVKMNGNFPGSPRRDYAMSAPQALDPLTSGVERFEDPG
jgi:hypothetical protein